MTVREYAARQGVTPQAVTKALSKGRITAGADGLIDPLQADLDWEANRGEDRSAPMKGVSKAALRSAKTTLAEEGMDTGEKLTFVEAHTAHEIAKTHLARLKLAREKGELIDREKAKALVFRLAREQRDAWSSWPARVSALMASELNVAPHAMQMLLEKYTRQNLSEIAEVDVEQIR